MSRRKIVAGTTNNLIPVFVRDTSKTDGSGLSVGYNASGITAEYRRKGDTSWTSISVVTKTLGAFTSGGWCADGGLTGAHEFAPPDAAFAAGATSVAIRVYGVANMLPVLLEFELMTLNDQASGGKVPATLAAADVSGNLPTDVQTIKTQSVTCGAGVTVSPFVGNATAAIVVDGAGLANANVVKVGPSGSGTAQTAKDLGASATQTGDTYAYVVTTLAGVWTKLAAWVLGADHKAVLSSDETGSGLSSVAPASTALSTAQWTNTRAANLDNLDVASSVLQTAINNINNLSALANFYGPQVMEIPDSSSTLYPFTLTIRDSEGHLVDLDSSPTLTAYNAAGTDRSANWSAVTHVSTGVYQFTYSVASNAAEEGLHMAATGAVSSSARRADFSCTVANYDSITTLAAIKAKTDNLPSDPASETNATTNKSAILTAVGTPTQEGNYNAAKTAAQAGDAMTLTTGERTTLTASIWGAATSGLTTVGSIGLALVTLIGKFAGITSVAQWLGMLAGKQAANSTAQTEMQATGAGSGTYNPANDSMQAIRERGDAAWITGSGGGSGGDAGLDDITDATTYPSGTLAGGVRDILAKVLPITAGGAVQVTGPVAKNLNITVKRRHDYKAADGNSLAWSLGGAFPDLTAATISFAAKPGPDARDSSGVQITGQITATGAVDVASGSSQSVHVDLDATTDLTVTASPYWRYDLTATLSGDGDAILLASGIMNIQQDYAP